ncbi:hypothetical protein Q9K02_06710 [Qipengyuania sp. G39]|uniref:DUF11 domain-containing protein n=1 Tax=Qipengyuania profundimaris TaxID=3067652 RepID=A0ABT9HNV8_9SPHN|nr:hypothetical protein [Qipengyuania sp. G39]MDP4574829.1 hypothetical protein [Qipengyuania sp. G39]
MKRTSRLLGAVSIVPLIALGASPALAAGTDAGTTIQNTVSVSYQVGGVTQNDQEATDEFVVDRKIDLTVAEVGGTQTVVSPGSTQQVTTFQVTNLSNDTADFGLTVDQQAGGAGAFGGTDNFDTTNTLIYVDTDGDGDWTDEVAVTYIDELAPDETRTIFVVSDVPIDQVTGDVATVILTATAYAGGTAGSQGALLATSATNTVDAVDTVLADGAGETDAQYDGAFSAADDYVVSAAALTVTKISSVIEDPVSGTTNPKAIPGATIQYCISVTNAAGSATATGVNVTDDVPTGLTYTDTNFPVSTNSTSCDVAGATGTGSYADPTVSGTLDDIAAGETRTLIFQAIID